MSAPSLISFGDCDLDLTAFELRRGGQAQAVEPQVFELIVHLARNPGRLITKDELIQQVWGGRIVSDAALLSRIKSARRAIGDDGEQQRLIRTVHGRGIRFIGDVVRDATTHGGAAMAAAADNARAEPQESRSQQVRFCASGDGVRIAYATAGQGPPLIKAANWLNHLEYDWQSPLWRHWLGALALDRGLLRYDIRGGGLSDWNVGEISFEAFVSDLEAVVEASGHRRFALLGITQGCSIAAAYAARHPDRVTHLLLYGGFARGWARRDSANEVTRRAAFEMLIEHGWGQDNPAFRQVFASIYIPGASLEQMQWFDDLHRFTASSRNALRIYQAFGQVDVSAVLPKVRAPTLVLHRREDSVVPLEEGRLLATEIPGARFVPLEGRNHLPLDGEASWQRIAAEMRAFLDGAAQ